MNKSKFIAKFSEIIKEEQASLFIGAGLSIGSGFVDWKNLIRSNIKELNLDIDRENDFPQLAQFYIQEMGNKNEFIQTIVRKLDLPAKGNINHEIITQIPIKNIWTTNFDSLIEDTYRTKGKICNITRADEDMTIYAPHFDIKLYKMHGDLTKPNDIVISQIDYENYENNYYMISTKLINELAEKTFLFIGYSISDPNFKRLLAKIKVRFGDNVKQHYTIMIEPTDEYEKNKFYYFVNNLKMYGIQTIVINDFSELTEILNAVKDACPKNPEIITNQNERNKFIVDKFKAIVESKQEQEIYLSAVFSSFAISNSPEYIDGEPVNNEDHITNILEEKRLLCDLLESGKATIKLLLFPPSEYQWRHDIRYKTLLQWLEDNVDRDNLDVRCTSLNYYKNMIIIKDQFCILSNYSEKKGYNENRIYYDDDNIDSFINDFNLKFENAVIAKSKKEVIAYYKKVIHDSKRSENWRTIDRKILDKWHNYRLLKNEIKNAEGKSMYYTYVDHPGSVIIIPLLKETNKILLVEQYRYLIDRKSLEFPCGGINSDEKLEDAALRELIEETGYESDKITIIGSFYTSNGYSNEKMHIALAENIIKSEKQLEADEMSSITLQEMTMPEIIRKITSGIIDDGPTISAAMIMEKLYSK